MIKLCVFLSGVIGGSILWAEDFSDKESLLALSDPSMDQQNHSKGFISSQLRDSQKVFAVGEVLLWKANQTLPGYATATNIVSDRSKIKTLDPSWDVGFRVGFGYNTPHDGWDFYGGYTQFETQSYQIEKTQLAQEVSASWDLHLQMGDGEVGKEFVVTEMLSFRPHLGIRGAWVFQKYQLDYQTNSQLKFRYFNHFLGIGGRVGCDSLWHVIKGLSLLADGSFTLLSGYYDIYHRKNPMSYNENSSSVVALLDLTLGVKYDMQLYKDKIHLGMQAGFECSSFLNQYQFLKNLSGYNQEESNLSFIGLTVGCRLDF